MSLYFFDIHDGKSQIDENDTECASLDEVRDHAMMVLPDMARDEAANGNDRLTYTVVVSNKDHRPVFSATLSLVGLWLNR